MRARRKKQSLARESVPTGGQANRFLLSLTRIPPSPYLVVVIPMVIACGRVAAEHLMFPYLGDSGYLFSGMPILLNHVVHFALFYALMQLLLTLALALAAARKPTEMLGPVTFGLLLGWLPPLLDALLPAQKGANYTYFWEFRWHFAAPYQLLGETITCWVAIIGSSLFVYWLTRRWGRSLAALALAYAVF